MKLKEIFKFLTSIFRKKFETKESIANDIKVHTVVYFVLSIAALALSILNLVNNYITMMYTTLTLMGVCLICALIVLIFKKRKLASILLALAVMGIFSYYAVAGQNDGFAILWIALVPAVGMLLFEFRLGFIVSVYFALFLIAIMYTPLRDVIPAKTARAGASVYTETFMIRFPLLYLADFFVSFLLAAQKTYYLDKSEHNAFYDALTDLKNRRYYNEDVVEIGKKSINMDLTILSFDLNNLKVINDGHGHDKGDLAIISTAKILSETFSPHTDKIYRTGGDEFAVFFIDKENKVNDYVKHILDKCDSTNIDGEILSISYGYVKGRDYINDSINDLILKAEANMYVYKNEYRKKLLEKNRFSRN